MNWDTVRVLVQEKECSLVGVQLMILNRRSCPFAQAPRRECVYGRGGIAPRILNLSTR